MLSGPDHQIGVDGRGFHAGPLTPVGAGTSTLDRPPHLGYAGIVLGQDSANVTLLNGARHPFEKAPHRPTELLPLLQQKLPADSLLSRIVAVGIAGANGQGSELTREYWSRNAIVPFHVDGDAHPDALAEQVASRFNHDGTPTSRLDANRFVHPDLLIPLDLYRESDPKDTAMAEFWAGRIKEKRIKFFELSASEFGGGVAKNRHRTTSVYEQLGLDDRWGVQSDDKPSRYDITKEDIHNVLQMVQEPGRGLTQEKMDELREWGQQDIKLWKDRVIESDVIIVHDPQPVVAGMINEIRALEEQRREAGIEDKRRIIIYRSHTQPDAEACDTPGTPQNQTWNLLWNEGGINEADFFIAHPILNSIPGNVPREKVGLMGATEDRHDGLNMDLPPAIMEASKHVIDDVLRYQKVQFRDTDGTVLREVELEQQPIDWDRGYTLVFNRFDEAKLDVEALRHQLHYVKNEVANSTDPRDIIPMVITGNMAMDDPSAAKVFMQVYDELMLPEYDDIRDEYVKLMIAPTNDFLANTLMTNALVYLLNSRKEGYETVVKSALLKGKPVVSTEIGGPKVQLEPVTFTGTGEMIIDDKDSFLIDPYNYQQAANYFSILYNPHDRSVYNSLQQAAAEHGMEPRDTTMQNVANYLFLIDRITDGAQMPGDFAMIHQVMEAAYDEEMRLQGMLPRHADIFVHAQVPALN